MKVEPNPDESELQFFQYQSQFKATGSHARHRKATTMKMKYFGEARAFEFVWNNADADGLWSGNAEVLARRFNVSADEAYDTLSELTDRNRLERVGNETYIITGWRERDDLGEGELES